MLEIQLRDNVKARILNNKQNNEYVHNDEPICRSQIEIHNYLMAKAVEHEVKELEAPVLEPIEQ